MLITIALEFDTTIGVLLGETISDNEENDIEVISKKLNDINLQLAKRKIQRIRTVRYLFVFLCLLLENDPQLVNNKQLKA